MRIMILLHASLMQRTSMVLTVWTYITGIMVLLDIGDEIVRRQGRMVFFLFGGGGSYIVDRSLMHALSISSKLRMPCDNQWYIFNYHHIQAFFVSFSIISPYPCC